MNVYQVGLLIDVCNHRRAEGRKDWQFSAVLAEAKSRGVECLFSEIPQQGHSSNEKLKKIRA